MEILQIRYAINDVIAPGADSAVSPVTVPPNYIKCIQEERVAWPAVSAIGYRVDYLEGR
jgi:hypothetical protein